MPTLDQLLFLAERNSWQDLALCAGNVFFCFTLVPMLRHPARPPLLTCIPTGIALLAGGFVFAESTPVAHGANASDNRHPMACIGIQKTR